MNNRQARQHIVLVNGPARQDRSYPMPELPEGIDDPPRFLSLEKAAEHGGVLRVSSTRLISDLYELMRERDGTPSYEGLNLVYAHIPEERRDEYAEAEIEQLRQWCTHPRKIPVRRQGSDGTWATTVVSCPDCHQQVRPS